MGCDIHMYVEYKPAMPYDRWVSFGGRINPGRDYTLFTTIAGVRGDACDAAVQARGLPDDVAYAAHNDGFLTTHDIPDDVELHGEVGGVQYIAHPDWHSHSWLTPTELELCLMRVKNEGSEASDEYYALLASMQELERRGNEVRVVFWFDN